MQILSREAAVSLYQSWRAAVTDAALAAELAEIEGDSDAIYDRFFAELEFGTGGLRGRLGAGPRRMNIHTVARATRGLASYIKKSGLPLSAAIAYDSRINSQLFAETAAKILSAEGIRTHLYPRLMPTPALSYAVRSFGCGAGIVITASHNPAVYNGYKVYGPDGCQITLEAARAITEEIEKAEYFGILAGDDTNSEYIGEEVVDAFIEGASACVPVGGEGALSIVYTPLCGAGMECVTRTLALRGFDRVTTVSSQATPDGNFPGLPYPNPEMPEALAEGLSLCRELNADLLLATDPDCDRVGIAVRDGGDYTLLTGNECGCVLLAYLLETKLGSLPAKPVIIKTIVTTDMAAAMAAAYGAELREVLTGFKFIGEQIGALEARGEEGRYLFGFEESYGYLCGSYVRDKDGVSASLLICEAARYYKAKGMTLLDKLRELYRRFGYHAARLESVTLEGSDGIERMGAIMKNLRENTPESICGRKLEAVEDYKLGVRRVIGVRRDAKGEETKLTLPASDVLKLRYEGGLTLTARPSGTEPKLKFYIAAAEASEAESRAVIEDASEAILAMVK